MIIGIFTYASGKTFQLVSEFTSEELHFMKSLAGDTFAKYLHVQDVHVIANGVTMLHLRKNDAGKCILREELKPMD